jgi:hypothetical protein
MGETGSIQACSDFDAITLPLTQRPDDASIEPRGAVAEG